MLKLEASAREPRTKSTWKRSLDKRVEPRAPVHFPCSLRRDADPVPASYLAHTLDVSARGARFITSTTIKPGELLRCHFRPPGMLPIEIAVRAVWRTPELHGGSVVGVAFEEPDSLAALFNPLINDCYIQLTRLRELAVQPTRTPDEDGEFRVLLQARALDAASPTEELIDRVERELDLFRHSQETTGGNTSGERR